MQQVLQRFLGCQYLDLNPIGFKNLTIYGLANAEKGNHIVVRSVVQTTQDCIWHHGIYMGDETVARIDKDGNVSVVNFDNFVKDAVTVGTYVDKAGIIEYNNGSTENHSLDMIKIKIILDSIPLKRPYMSRKF
jgi:hypothetical protein